MVWPAQSARRDQTADFSGSGLCPSRIPACRKDPGQARVCSRIGSVISFAASIGRVQRHRVLWRSTDFILITATSTGSALTVDCRSCRWDDCSLKVLRRSTVLNSQFIVRLAVGCRSTACHHGHAAIPDRAHTLHHRQLCCNALFSRASWLTDPQTPKLSQKNRILDNGSYHE